MKENYVSSEELNSVIEKCNFKPSSRKVLVTMNEFISENDIELVSESEMTLDDWQYVIASGDNSVYKAGTKVYLDLSRLVKRVPNPNDRHSFVEKIDIQPFLLNGKAFALIDDNIVAGEEVELEIVDIKA